MARVVSLRVVRKRRMGKARPQDIKMLRDVMADLESGKVEEIAVVGLNRDGTMMRAWSGPAKPGNAFRMIGSIEKLREEYMRRNIET